MNNQPINKPNTIGRPMDPPTIGKPMDPPTIGLAVLKK